MDYKKAQTYWDEKDKNNVVMPKDKLLTWFDSFLKAHNALSLATFKEDYVDNTPLEYNYLNGKIYILTEGGHKFIGLEKNKNVAVSIFDSYKGFGAIQSAQIYANCEIVEQFSDEYYQVTDYKKMPRDVLSKFNLYLLRIDPTKINILSSDFKKDGYSNRQEIVF